MPVVSVRYGRNWAVTYKMCHHHPRACFINNSWLAETQRVKDRKINPQLKDLAALLLVEERINYKWGGASARRCCVVLTLERKGLRGDKGSSHIFTGQAGRGKWGGCSARGTGSRSSTQTQKDFLSWANIRVCQCRQALKTVNKCPQNTYTEILVYTQQHTEQHAPF